jgi:hypothetical protein
LIRFDRKDTFRTDQFWRRLSVDHQAQEDGAGRGADAEFNRDADLVSIGAEFAYAACHSGTGMNIVIVDSGFLAGHVREHGSLDTKYATRDRYFSVEAHGGETGPTPGFLTRRSTTLMERMSACAPSHLIFTPGGISGRARR